MTAAEAFITAFAKTLSRLNLYTLEHPVVEESVRDSLQKYGEAMVEGKDLTLQVLEKKLLLNGQESQELKSVKGQLTALLMRWGLESITFTAGLTRDELAAFYKLFTSRYEGKVDNEAITAALKERSIEHIKVNFSFYAKVAAETKPLEIEVQEQEDAEWIRQLENLSFDAMLMECVKHAASKKEDQQNLFERLVKQFQTELQESLRQATQTLEKEKKIITHEKERTEMVISNMADGVVMVDEQGRVLMMNPAAEKLYGVKLGETMGKPLSDQVKEEHMMTLAKNLSNATDEPMVKEVEINGASEDTRRTLRASSAMVQNPDGKIVGMVAVLSDVTKQRDLERLQSDFVANVTHELRAPLTAIKSSVGLLSDKATGTINDQQARLVAVANRNIDRLVRMISDLLDFSKYESGKLKIYTQPTDMLALTKEAADNMRPWADKRSLTVSVSGPDHLPLGQADPDRILQVLVNLLSNAIKFTPVGGKITLKVSSLQKPGIMPMVQVSVSDTGRGIAPADKERVFGKFVQLAAGEMAELKGTGLGLSIAKALVTLHSGQMWVDSQLGKGSTFHFTLPVFSDQKPAAPGAAPATPTAAQKSFLGRLFGLFR